MLLLFFSSIRLEVNVLTFSPRFLPFFDADMLSPYIHHMESWIWKWNFFTTFFCVFVYVTWWWTLENFRLILYFDFIHSAHIDASLFTQLHRWQDHHWIHQAFDVSFFRNWSRNISRRVSNSCESDGNALEKRATFPSENFYENIFILYSWIFSSLNEMFYGKCDCCVYTTFHNFSPFPFSFRLWLGHGARKSWRLLSVVIVGSESAQAHGTKSSAILSHITRAFSLSVSSQLFTLKIFPQLQFTLSVISFHAFDFFFLLTHHPRWSGIGTNIRYFNLLSIAPPWWAVRRINSLSHDFSLTAANRNPLTRRAGSWSCCEDVGPR